MREDARRCRKNPYLASCGATCSTVWGSHRGSRTRLAPTGWRAARNRSTEAPAAAGRGRPQAVGAGRPAPRRPPRSRHDLAAAVDARCRQRAGWTAAGTAGRRPDPSGSVPGFSPQRSARGGPREDPRHHEPRHGADGAVGHVVHLHQFAGPGGLGAVPPASRPLGEAAPPLGLHVAFAEGRRAVPAGPERALDDPPTVGTLSSRPLRASTAWMCALPMNGYLQSHVVAVLSSAHARRRATVVFPGPSMPSNVISDDASRPFESSPRGAEPPRVTAPSAAR